MAIIHHQNLAENSQIKPKKFQSYPQKLPNGISLWASLLSLFIYISIFYIFNLSPSSLLNTTNFWFFITNTLILIIAADFGAYTSSKKQAELYEEDYMIRNRANSVPTFESQYRELVKPGGTPLVEKVETPVEEKIKEVVVENKLQIATKSDLPMLSNEKIRETTSEFNYQKANDNKAREEKRNRAKRVRSMSDMAIPITNSEESDDKTILRRAESEKKRADEEEEEKDEFSDLSNEEVNRRVEEFIQRFQKQIRLQAAQNRTPQI